MENIGKLRYVEGESSLVELSLLERIVLAKLARKELARRIEDIQGQISGANPMHQLVCALSERTYYLHELSVLKEQIRSLETEFETKVTNIVRVAGSRMESGIKMAIRGDPIKIPAEAEAPPVKAEAWNAQVPTNLQLEHWVLDALSTGEMHHKQWYLHRIREALSIQEKPEGKTWEGIAP